MGEDKIKMDTIINYAYIILVPIIAIIGTWYYMSSHTIISTGPEGEAKGCFGVFVSFLLGGAVLVTLGIYAIAWCIDFVTMYWLWFAIPIGIIIVIIVRGCFVGDDKKETVNDKASNSIDDQQN